MRHNQRLDNDKQFRKTNIELTVFKNNCLNFECCFYFKTYRFCGVHIYL